jgi:hypothetical protein
LVIDASLEFYLARAAQGREEAEAATLGRLRLASICRMRSRVTLICCPTSSSASSVHKSKF